LSADIDRVVSAEAELSGVEARLHSDGFDIARRTGPLNLSATAASGGSINETVAGLLAGALKADATTTLTENAVHIDSGAIATGTVDATFSGDVSLADGTVKLDVAAQVLSAILPAAARAQFADKVSVTATLNRDAAGVIRLDPLTAKSGNIDAGGSIAYAIDRIDADLKGGLADISKLSPQLSGSANFTLRATGAPAAPDFAATVTSGKIAALGRELTDVSLTASGKVQPDSPTANVGLKATLAGQALAAEGVVKTEGEQHHIQGLLLTLGENRISGDLVLDEAFLPQGSLSLALSDLGPLASLASEQIAGQVDGTLRFYKADGLPQLAIDAKAASITRGDISVKDAELTGLVANYVAAPSISGKVRAVSVSSGATTVRNIDLSLARADSWTSFSGGAIVNNIEAQATGRLAVSDGTATVELATASANGSGLNGTLPNTIVTVRNAAAGSAGGPELAMDMAGETPALLSFGEGAGEVKIIVKKVTLRASGPANAQIIDGSATLEKVITSQAELSGVEAKLHSDRFDLANRSGPVTVSATAESGGSANATIAGLLAGMLKLDAAATVSKDSIHIEQGTFASDSVNAAVSGDASLADGSLRLDVKGDLLSALLPGPARTALDRQVSLTATVSRDASGLLRVDPVNVASGAFNTAGSVSYAPDALDLKLRGGFADVSKLSPNAAGSIGFEVSATGAPAAPDFSAIISSDKFTAAGRDITGLVLSASGKADLANPAANVTIKGNVAGQALAGEAALKTANGERRIDGLSLTLGSNKISGDLALDEAFVPEGALAFTLPDIGPLAALAFEQASGAINGSVRFTKADRIPQVAVDAKAASIVRGDLSVSNAEVTALVANYLVAPAVSGKVRAASVTSGGTSVRNVDLSLTRDGTWTGFDGGATVNDIGAKVAGRVAIAGGTTTVELASGSANARGITATLARPTTVTVKGDGATLDHATLGVGGGTVEVTGTAAQSLNLDVRINAVPANIVNAFAPGVNAAGTISGTARISGAAANPNIDYQLEWKGAQTTQTRDAGFGAMNVASSGTFSAGVVKFTANLGDAEGLSLRGGGSVETGGGRALSLDVSGQVPFGFLTRRLAEQGLALSGTSNVSLNIRGSTSAPVIGGTITTSGSRLVDARSGLAINNINADIGLANSVATIRRVDGKLSSGGSLSGSGTVAIDAARGFPADLTARIVEARYTDGRIVTANLGGDLTLKGPLTGQPLLSGTINLARTVITIPERLPGSAAALGVQHRNAPAAVREQSAAIQPASPSGSSATGLTLDLTINAPQEIFVRGRGLDAELGGSIKLTGPLSAPRAIGEFTLRRGRLTVLARRLTFTRGTLGFSGSLVPTLDFAAESTVSDTTVTIAVTGLANDPKFNFSSSPALPQDEVLARLIFGRSMSNLSPLQIAQLADAAAQLAGGGGSGSLLNTLRSKAGIDDLDITTDAQGRAAVSAGKYLNDRTYVTIQKGEKPGSGKATIDLNVGRGVKLRGEAAEDGSARGGIFYEREY
jgi:translocation and assembly module TamB